jgi:hypothetical protein
MTKQIVPKDATRRYNAWVQESPKPELQFKSYEGLKLIDYIGN